MKKEVFISIIIVIICLGVALGTVAYFTNGYTTLNINSNTNPIITIKGAELTRNTILPESEALRIDCAEKFTVKVLPVLGINFDFRVDGVLDGFKFQDYTNAFNVQVYDGYFTINTTRRLMPEVLQAAFPGKTITEVPEGNKAESLFVLSIETESNILNIELKGIGLLYTPVTGVEIDKSEIIF